MGITRFLGPVYGAKGLLWAVGPAAASSGASTHAPIVANSNIVLPVYEDWYITEFQVNCSTCSSVGNNFLLKSKGGSTTGISRNSAFQNSTITQTLATVNTGASTTLTSLTTITPTAGEYEGAWVPAGSSLYVVSSGINPPGLLSWNVRGYIRYVDSTRAV